MVYVDFDKNNDFVHRSVLIAWYHPVLQYHNTQSNTRSQIRGFTNASINLSMSRTQKRFKQAVPSSASSALQVVALPPPSDRRAPFLPCLVSPSPNPLRGEM